ncbi:phosphoenolpyruvate carboxykinase (ATP) [Mangrovivirga sp. M17]|uniref:Phosphoenolpyruvate carboxykinase (ATP) n=1 Tax=Mangrovivirga halotolerans TaxID=2993936 RepID=A0ABT3RWZ7_9BACT|nr:phosphoenolpyruvate carboxykinase (ATP) [Mangrovivirga halotolerans]MCX2745660.1 phosphoenolpyruvate carboxykinase (ATP) [Mangrovivirga halotolerans]
MVEYGLKSTVSGIDKYDIDRAGQVFWNLTPAELVEHALNNDEGKLTDTGALMCDTGKFTGRSPKDRFVVEDEKTKDSVWWGDINIPISPDHFDKIYKKMIANLEGKNLYVRDAFAGADPRYRLNLRVINTKAWQNLFCNNMFMRPERSELEGFDPNFTIICDPDFKADPSTDGTRQENFAIINFTKRMILIGGTAYAGEMKKGIFSVLNYILPHDENVLSMHCSANMSMDETDTAIFFGLSGTGKTTLSADPERHLIGDDEHGWTDNGVFNFEGGCYAKVIDLSREKEPEIWDAIKFGAIVENTRFKEGTRTVDYENTSVTENTRTAYPIHHIANAKIPSMGGIPKNIFFLTCDAFGVLPPISRLSKGQAMFHFISGYTAKVAGTEAGITEPVSAFSACFGAPFLPLHPTKYAEMLGEKMEKYDVNVWLVNTGWSGGPYGVGSRMKLPYTRAMITAALNGTLAKSDFVKHPVFGCEMPTSCPNVPDEVLDPGKTWKDKEAYDEKANNLASMFIKNFDKYSDFANDEIMAGAPITGEKVK